MNKIEIKKRLKLLGIFPKKSLGQNFLINPWISEQMSHHIQKLKPSKIIEVGPGVGSLTEFLIPLGIPLELIELDKKIAQYWKSKNLNVLEANVLQVDSKKLFPKNSALVGNLPYHISNRLIVHSSIHWNQVKFMILMVQKETAERMLSPCGQKSFGSLSVITQYIWDIQKLMSVPSSDYYPKPKVDGCVLVFQRKPPPLIEANPFHSFVKSCFVQKRKILSKKLKNRYGDSVISIFNQLQISPQARAEELSVNQFVELYKMICSDEEKS